MSSFYVCTKCFGLTSKGTGMQRCSCEEYKSSSEVDCPSGYHLCDICAASIAGGTSRYSWNACEVCLKFNRKLATDYGVNLPLGPPCAVSAVGAKLAKGLERLASLTY